MRRFRSIIALTLVALVTTGCAQFFQDPDELAPNILEQSISTLSLFRSQDDLKEIDDYIVDAAGVLILPRVVKGGLIGAAEAGTGVLLARSRGSEWSYPAFYLLGAGSVGFQAGLQETAIIMAIRSEDALEAIIEHQGKFGADIGITVGWIGKGVETSTTMSAGYDVVAISAAGIGLFGGISLEGAALIRRNDLNGELYGEGAKPRDILFGSTYRNSLADPLRAAINPR